MPRSFFLSLIFMFKSRFQKPYNEDGKTNYPARNKAGVYVIMQRGEVVYVGHSGTDIYKTLYRHFQSWNDRTQFRAVYDAKKSLVRVIYTGTSKRAQMLEKALILKHKPKDNTDKLNSILTNEEKGYYSNYVKTPVVSNDDLPF